MHSDPFSCLSDSLDAVALRSESGNSDSGGAVPVLVAVSGGADSVALLHLFRAYAESRALAPHCITVDHRIRSEAESGGDADFVADLCASFQPPIPCVVARLEAGEVDALARKRGKGVEEAARFLRYCRFEEAADAIGARFILTAHNRDDQFETVLMRFFQGSGPGSLAGIARVRGRYLRPLLDVPHADLVSWLTERGYKWREDATNSDDRYLRNRIRLRLVPLLGEILPGWESGVAAAVAKAQLDDRLCRELDTAMWRRSGDRLAYPLAGYLALDPALRLRFLLRGLTELGADHRVPFPFLSRIISLEAELASGGPGRFAISGSGFEFRVERDTVFWGPDIVQKPKTGYLVYVSAPGTYTLAPGLTVTLSGSGGAVSIDRLAAAFTLPVTIRTRAGGDSLPSADGKRKTLKKLMNEWSVSEGDRDRLPLIECSGTLRAVYGSLLGYPDWIVHT